MYTIHRLKLKQYTSLSGENKESEAHEDSNTTLKHKLHKIMLSSVLFTVVSLVSKIVLLV